MLFSTVTFLSLLTAALAVAIKGEGERPISADGLVGREDAPTELDLLSSCPGGPGSPNIEEADRCTLINVLNNPDIRQWITVGDVWANCDAQQPRSVTVGGETTPQQKLEINDDLGVDLENITVGGGTPYSASPLSKSVQYNVPPGRQAVYVMGVAFKSDTANIQVNYGDRQFEHYIWYTSTTVTQLTPKLDDVQYDVYETDCGQDPRNLDGFSAAVVTGI